MAQLFKQLFPLAAPRPLSHAFGVAAAGGVEAWNEGHEDVRHLAQMLNGMCRATSVDEALKEVSALMSLEHNLWTYAYMRALEESRAVLKAKASCTTATRSSIMRRSRQILPCCCRRCIRRLSGRPVRSSARCRCAFESV